jgi:hypothetical protein
LAIVVFAVRTCKQSIQNYPARTTTTTEGDWRHHKLIYTKHARCRMQCREISETGNCFYS